MIRHYLSQFIRYYQDDDFRREKEEKTTDVSMGTASYLDIISRNAQQALETPATKESIKWSDGGKYIFGEVGKFPLFYIHDKNHGGGLLRYQLEVKFIDQRWDSDNIDELKDVALQQLNTLILAITK